MTDIKARLDEIAKEAVVTWESLVLAHMFKPSGEFPDQASHIRAAINQALEVVLTAEPSEGMFMAASNAIPDRPMSYDSMKAAIYRAMSSALLEELKK